MAFEAQLGQRLELSGGGVGRVSSTIIPLRPDWLLRRASIAHAVTSLGIDDEFGQSAYVAEHLYEEHGMTGLKMAEAALKLLGK